MAKIKYGIVYNTEEAPDVLFVPVYPKDESEDIVIVINLYTEKYFARAWDNMTMGSWIEVEDVSRLNERIILTVLFSIERNL